MMCETLVGRMDGGRRMSRGGNGEDAGVLEIEVLKYSTS